MGAPDVPWSIVVFGVYVKSMREVSLEFLSFLVLLFLLVLVLFLALGGLVCVFFSFSIHLRHA